VKLVLPEGGIDFVVSQNLTDPGYDEWALMDQPVKVETATKFVAKKMWQTERENAAAITQIGSSIAARPTT
jgi:hypothetical protein